MGLIPKDKREQIKREQKKAKEQKKRKRNTRIEHFQFLILCEGEKTEPNYLNTGITRGQYITKIEKYIRKATLNAKYKYKKNDPSFYPLLQKYGNEKNAIVYAEKLQKLYGDKNYAEHNPCTFVSDLVKELKNPESLNEVL